MLQNLLSVISKASGSAPPDKCQAVKQPAPPPAVHAMETDDGVSAAHTRHTFASQHIRNSFGYQAATHALNALHLVRTL